MTNAELKETRDGYGEALVRLARKDKNIVALDCDLGRSTRSYRITEADESRFFEMGIAEQDMISTAAGMAKMGKIVFANSFAIFITGRAYDQIRQQVALPNLNVKICGSSGGITQGPDGATHQSILDVGLMRLLPNMVVVNPADSDQSEKAVEAAYNYKGPVYIRLSRYKTGRNVPTNTEFSLGKGQVLKQGKDIVLCGTGPVLKEINIAAEALQKEGIDVGVVNFHTLKPFDEALISSLRAEYKYIISIEEHSIYGGLGTAIAEVLAKKCPGTCSLETMGMMDEFGESGTAEELIKKYKLNSESIINSVRKITSLS